MQNLPGPVIFLTGMVAMFLVVPWQRIKELFWVGMVGGVVVGIVLVHLWQNVFGFWVYPGPSDLVHIMNLPVFLILSWFSFIIVFAHLLAQYHSYFLIGLINFTFAAGAAVMHFLLLNEGMLIYNNWSLFATFILSLMIHLGITLFLYVTGHMLNAEKLKWG